MTPLDRLTKVVGLPLIVATWLFNNSSVDASTLLWIREGEYLRHKPAVMQTNLLSGASSVIFESQYYTSSEFSILGATAYVAGKLYRPDQPHSNLRLTDLRDSTDSIFWDLWPTQAPTDVTSDGTTLYWMSHFGINSVPLAGPLRYDVITIFQDTSPSTPMGLATDGQRLFWADYVNPSIFSTDLDGETTRKLVDLEQTFGDKGRHGYFPRNVATNGNYLYWVDGADDAIFRVGLDGSFPTKLIDLDATFGDSFYSPTGLTVSHDKIFWSQLGAEELGIFSSDLDGSNIRPIVEGIRAGGLAYIIPEPGVGSLMLLAAGALLLRGWLRAH